MSLITYSLIFVLVIAKKSFSLRALRYLKKKYFIGLTIRIEYSMIPVKVKEISMDSKDVLIDLRKSTGMNRREFADYFEIPYRTIQEWELGNRKMPEYLLRLMIYKIRVEEKKGIFRSEDV